jgi:hypothetical protein
MSDLSTRLKRLISDIQRNQPDIAVGVAASFLAAIRNRVQLERVGVDGQPYSNYSTRPLSPKTWPSLPSRGNKESKIDQATKQAGGLFSYKTWRDVNDLKTDRKDFTFTGEMFKSMQVSPVAATNKGVKVTISPRTERSQDVLAANEKREGKPILQPDKDTIQEQELIVAQELERLIQKAFS